MAVSAVRTILDGFLFGEGPRWHDGELWFNDIHGHQVRRTTVDGRASVVADIPQDEPSGLGWLPDGRLLVVAMDTQKLLRIEPDDTVAEHADLSPLARGSINDMIVADGAVWVADPLGARVFRVLEGGEVTDSIEFADVIPVACVLGGDDRRTLLMCVAGDWHRDVVKRAPTARIDACEVDVPGAGRP